jgi:predicted HTH domain antitoxin
LASKKITGVRLDGELDRDVEEVVREESVDKSTALRMLVGEGYREWKLKRALQQLREGTVSIWQASKIAGMALWDFVATVKKEEGIQWTEFDTSEILSERPSS